jgi:hypothetical protein
VFFTEIEEGGVVEGDGGFNLRFLGDDVGGGGVDIDVEAPGFGGEAGAEEGVAGEGVGFWITARDVFEVGVRSEERVWSRWGVGSGRTEGGEGAEAEFDGVSTGEIRHGERT